MTSRQIRALRSIEQASAFLGTLRDRPVRVEVLFDEMKRALVQIREVGGQQNAATRSRRIPTLTTNQARAVLRQKHLVPVARDGVALLRGMPGIRESLRVPPATASIEQHRQAVDRISNALRPYVSTFHKKGYPRGFLKEMHLAATAFERAAAHPDSGRAAVSRSTADLADAIRDGREIVRRLDGAISAAYFGNEHVLAQWRSAKRIPARQGRPPKRGK